MVGNFIVKKTLDFLISNCFGHLIGSQKSKPLFLYIKCFNVIEVYDLINNTFHASLTSSEPMDEYDFMRVDAYTEMCHYDILIKSTTCNQVFSDILYGDEYDELYAIVYENGLTMVYLDDL